MKSGRLDQRVTIQQRVESRDGFGAVVWTWEDLATIWAAVEPLRGDEFFAAAQVQNRLMTRIRIRYRAGIRAKQRVAVPVEVEGSPIPVRYYDIESVQEVGRRQELHLICVDRESDGFQD